MSPKKMWRNIMKKQMLVLVAIAAVMLASGCVSSGSENAASKNTAEHSTDLYTTDSTSFPDSNQGTSADTEWLQHIAKY